MLVSSQVLWMMPQRDGRIAIRERHIDIIGNEYISDYMVPLGTSLEKINSHLLQAARSLEEELTVRVQLPSEENFDGIS